jgi:cytochrome-b5 reductase
MELVIKKYPDGKVSGWMHDLKVGDLVEVKGPFPKLAYVPNMKKSIGMICGGTGITPMLQVYTCDYMYTLENIHIVICV